MSSFRWHPDLASIVAIVLSLLAPAPSPAAEGALDRFPIVLSAGLDEAAASTSDRILLDLPFSNDRGYGHTGGASRGSIHDAGGGGSARGGDPAWPLAWREGMEGYAFRLPRGRYLLELCFVETEVAHPGLRVFDVIAEGSALFAGVDIAARAGDFAWLTLRGSVGVFDGWLDLAFKAAPGARPPRVSRIRISEDVPEELPEAPSLTVRGGIGCNLIAWTSPVRGAVAGFEVSRSESEGGPFVPLTTDPVATTWLEDGRARLGRSVWYVVRAIDVHGRRGAPSTPASAAARSAGDLGLRTYALLVPNESLGDLRTRSTPASRVAAELAWLGAPFPVEVSLDTSASGWREKKSYDIRLGPGGTRALGRRRHMRLEAAACDPTRLEAFARARATDALGLASPAIEPVALLVNGRFEGLYLDVEAPDAGFRRRVRLDTVGLMALRTRADAVDRSWDPHGERIGSAGHVWSLTELVHQLNLLGDGEVADFFAEAFTLDRWLDRAVLLALLGERDRGDALDIFLRDSRNGKWEIFPGRPDALGRGAWSGARTSSALAPSAPSGGSGGSDASGGSSDSRAEAAGAEPEAAEASNHDDARRLLFGSALAAGLPPAGDAFVLESRFFHDPGLREAFLERARVQLAGPLAPDRLRDVVDGAFAAIRPAALEDAALWPATTSEEAILSGTGRVLAAFGERSARIRAYLERPGAAARPGLVLEEVLIAPREGEPWVAVRNGSATTVSLGEYLLVKAPSLADAAGRRTARLPARILAPGERLAIPLTDAETFRVGPGERFLALYRRDAAAVSSPGAAPDPGGNAPAGTDPHGPPVDFVVLGQPTRGVSYGRRQGGDSRWTYLGPPTPGARGEGEELLPPHWAFQHGLALDAGGSARVWFRPRSVGERPPAARTLSVRLLHREEGQVEYRVRDLTWDERTFRFVGSMERGTDPRRISYYFVAASASGVERSYPLPAPALTYAVPLLPAVKINEVLPRPTREPGAPGEFVELYNASDAAVDLEGYHLTDTRRNPSKWRIPAGATIPPKGFLVILADGLNESLHASFKLSNAGEYIGLFGRMEEGNLPVDAIAFPGMRVGESWGALPDGTKNFRSWKDPTPGARNVPRIPREYLEGRGDGAARPGGGVEERDGSREWDPDPDAEREPEWDRDRDGQGVDDEEDAD